MGQSGYEIFSVLKNGINAVPEKFSEYLTVLMKQKDQVLDSRKLPSIMLGGGIVEDEGIIKIIEDAGARVVADDLCSGSRYYDAKVDVTNDPYLALAKRYLTRIPCSRMTNVTQRINNVIKRIKDCSISGYIYHSLKFCDHNLYDFPLIKKEFLKHNIPILPLHCDYNSANEGQIKTRVEAFVEQLAVQTV
jgi:benzoyl-CoA reductase/2-hydroxyglutaryl-CoA dehydratase subunit BcrC/BadD/HgdB